MHHHRLKMLAQLGALNFNEEPNEPQGGGNEEPPAGAEGAGQQNEEPKQTHPWDNPKDAEAEIKRLRDESAGYRTQKNELKRQLEGAKSQEDIDAAIDEWQKKTAKLERENLILAHGKDLPENLRKYVIGDTEDEIKASIKDLTPEPRNAPPSRVGGGLNPGEEAKETDPGKLAARVRQNSRLPRI